MTPKDPVEVAVNLLARIEQDLQTVRALLTGHQPKAPEDLKKQARCSKCGSTAVIETMGGWTCPDCGGSSDQQS